jgi:hypothetical protein
MKSALGDRKVNKGRQHIMLNNFRILILSARMKLINHYLIDS